MNNSINVAIPVPTTDEIIARMPENMQGPLRNSLETTLRSQKQIRVYCDGVFDMFHFGHMRMLKQIKDIIPNVHLIVGVCADTDIQANKGSRIMSDSERIESIKHCKWADEILFPAPWCPDVEFLVCNNFDFVAHDVAPYGGEGTEDVYDAIKKNGM
jgi:choline-phosphate cytidylyltransferase